MHSTPWRTKSLTLTTILALVVTWTGLAGARGQADILIPLGKAPSSHIRIEITHPAPHPRPHVDVQITGHKVNRHPIYLDSPEGLIVLGSSGAGPSVTITRTHKGDTTVYEVQVHGVPEVEDTPRRFTVTQTPEGYEVQYEGQGVWKRARFRQVSPGKFEKVGEDVIPAPDTRAAERPQEAEQMTVIPEQQPSIGTVDPIPEQQPSIGTVDPIPEQQPSIGTVDPIPEQQPSIGTVDPIPEQQPSIGTVDPIPEQQPSIGTVDPVPPPAGPLEGSSPLQGPGYGLSPKMTGPDPRGGIAADVHISPRDFQSR
jgi:hypothetical protein